MLLLSKVKFLCKGDLVLQCLHYVLRKLLLKLQINSLKTFLSHLPSFLDFLGTHSTRTWCFAGSNKRFCAMLPVVVVPPAPTGSGLSTFIPIFVLIHDPFVYYSVSMQSHQLLVYTLPLNNNRDPSTMQVVGNV